MYFLLLIIDSQEQEQLCEFKHIGDTTFKGNKSAYESVIQH